MKERTNCPKCHITLVGPEIPLGLYETGLYGDMENCKHIAEQSYGWTEDNKLYFTINCILVKNIGSFSSYYMCEKCGHKFSIYQ